MALDRADTGHDIELGGWLRLPEAHSVAEGRATLGLSRDVERACAEAERRLAAIVAEGRHVYGVTTGFGPLANRLVGPGHGVDLQQNLIHHLASGLGPELDWSTARAVVLSRLVSIAKGASGASAGTVRLLVRLLRSDLAPVLPSRGTVGASGDLTPLAHMVLCLQGRGEFRARDGRRLSGPEALAALGVAPLDLENRDGLALVNGTSAMTGIAIGNASGAAQAGRWALALTAALAETLHGRAEAWDARLIDLRPHPGQVAAAGMLRRRVTGSERLETVPLAARRLVGTALETEEVAGQDAYTLRCAPQVIGAFLDALDWHDRVVETELNSVSDNPVFPEDGDVPALHGGNFMGQHVALASDALASALVVLAGLAERQVARLTDERLNRGLPPFLHGGAAGLNSGFMGAQVTATAVLAEMRATGPASAHSLSTNGANQDVVSLGTIAARLARQKVDVTFEIEAILALCVAQAIDIRSRSGPGAFSPAARAVHAFVRSVSAPLERDRPLGEEIAALADQMRRQPPPE